MRILGDVYYKEYGNIPYSLLNNFLNKITDSDNDWTETHPGRTQIVFINNNTHLLTNTDKIPLPLENSFSNVIFTKYYHSWRNVLIPIIEYLENFNLRGSIVNRCFLGRNGPNSGWELPHIDEHPAAVVSKRFHVVIETDPKALLIIDNKNFHFEQSKIFELNNMISHTVKNNGISNRTHLIVDFYHPAHVRELIYGTTNKKSIDFDWKLTI